MITEEIALKHYEKAVMADNRDDLPCARENYLLLYQTLKAANDVSFGAFDWNRIASFLYENNCFAEALFFAKQSTINGSNDCLSLFVRCCQQIANPVEYLEWIKPFIVANPMFDQSSEFFRLLSSHSDLYQEIFNAFEIIEEGFLQKSTVNSEQYISYLELMIDLEIKEGNMPQARLYLRKWLMLDFNYLGRVDKMLIYALFLDDLPYFLKRKDTRSLIESAREETKLFYVFAKQLDEELSVSEQLFSSFCAHSFANPLLKQKQQAYIKLIYAVQGKSVVEKPSSYDWTEYKAFILSNGIESFQHFHNGFTSFADLEEALSLYQVFKSKIFPPSTEPLTGVSVAVLGGGNQIGGSCLVISVGDSHLMIDAGGFIQSKEEQPIDLTPIKERGIALEDIDALIITHSHMDHIGNIPAIHGICDTLPMYATSETKDIMWLMLKEQEKYNPELRKSGLIDKCMVNINLFGEKLSVSGKNGKWNIQFFGAGHIRGAVSALIEKDGKTIFVTGDYSVTDQRTVKGLKIPPHIRADIVVTESTYGFYPTSASVSRKRQEKMFIDQLLSMIKGGGTVLIPAFALGRAQEIVSIIKAYLPELDFPVYLDGMVSQITELYDRNMKKDRNHVKSLFGHGVSTAQQNYQAIGFENFLDHIVDKGNCCVIASSGMLLEGTKSSVYAKKLIENPKNAIIFTGYLDEESPGFAVSQASSSILIDGEKKDIKASVLSLRLSAHASREEIIQTVLTLQPKHVILVHGDSARVYKPAKMVGQPYPSVTNLLESANMNVIQSQNGQTYHF